MMQKIIFENKEVFIAMAEHMLSTIQAESDDRDKMIVYEELLDALDNGQELTINQYSLVVLLCQFFTEKYKTLSIQYLRAEKETSILLKHLKEDFKKFHA